MVGMMEVPVAQAEPLLATLQALTFVSSGFDEAEKGWESQW